MRRVPGELQHGHGGVLPCRPARSRAGPLRRDATIALALRRARPKKGQPPQTSRERSERSERRTDAGNAQHRRDNSAGGGERRDRRPSGFGAASARRGVLQYRHRCRGRGGAGGGGTGGGHGVGRGNAGERLPARALSVFVFAGVLLLPTCRSNRRFLLLLNLTI